MPANHIVWTPVMEARLLQLLEQKKAYAIAADILSREFRAPITKNACIGKGRRLQVPLRMPARKGSSCLKSRKRKSRSPRSPPPRKRNGVAPRISLQSQQYRKTRQLRSRRAQPPRLLTLLQLTSNSCRWPIGDRAPYLFCGDPQADGSSYCLKHTLIAKPSYGKMR